MQTIQMARLITAGRADTPGTVELLKARILEKTDLMLAPLTVKDCGN